MMRGVEAIYRRMPTTLQNLGITVYGLRWYHRRFGGVFQSELQSALARERYGRGEWEGYTVTKLRALLSHAHQTVPYYSELLTKAGITATTLRRFEIDDLARIPILDKQTFRRLCTKTMLSRTPEADGVYQFSSGSTGTPTKVLYSAAMQQRYFAIVERSINYPAGLHYKMPRGTVGGRRIVQDGDAPGPFYRHNYVERQTYFSAYHISLANVTDYLEGMRRYRPYYMCGYSSGNLFLAQFIERSGLRAPPMRAVLTSSEKLTEEAREVFRRVYGCEAFDSYNGVDLCNLIAECECHRLHVVPDAGIVEVLRPDGSPCTPGETGEVVSTGFLNFDQPLIRYRIGDYVTLSRDQSCSCGRAMPVIDEIIGRLEDTILGPDGRVMVRFHGIFINVDSVLEGQVVQHDRAVFELRVVVWRTPTKEEVELLRSRMFSQLGRAIDVTITVVENIPRGPNGKFKAVVSLVGTPEDSTDRVTPGR